MLQVCVVCLLLLLHASGLCCALAVFGQELEDLTDVHRPAFDACRRRCSCCRRSSSVHHGVTICAEPPMCNPLRCRQIATATRPCATVPHPCHTHEIEYPDLKPLTPTPAAFTLFLSWPVFFISGECFWRARLPHAAFALPFSLQLPYETCDPWRVHTRTCFRFCQSAFESDFVGQALWLPRVCCCTRSVLARNACALDAHA